jgi:hypothetical protein
MNSRKLSWTENERVGGSEAGSWYCVWICTKLQQSLLVRRTSRGHRWQEDGMFPWWSWWWLVETLNLLVPNRYHELVNKSISQVDAMKKTQKDRKRQADFTSGSGLRKKFHFAKKHTHGSVQSFSSRQWRVTPSQNKPPENFQYQKDQQKCPSLKNFHPTFSTTVDSSCNMQMSVRNPKQQ